MSENKTISKDSERGKAAQALLDAAYAYWKLYQVPGGGGAIQWLSDTDGRLLIFTRGEYRETLLHNIHDVLDMGKEVFFVEELEGEEDE